MSFHKGTILIVASMPKHGFSGGRYHTLMLAKGLAREGHRLKILTNNLPRMWNELQDVPDFGNVEFFVTESFDLASIGEDNIDHVFCVPDLGWTGAFLSSLQAQLKFSTTLTLLNFETPNWFNSLSKFQRPRFFWWPWWVVSLSADRILSSTGEGTRFARRYFWPKRKHSFLTVPAPINSFALTKALATRQENTHKSIQIFLPTRIRGGDHKGIHEFDQILESVPSGACVIVLSDDPDNALVRKLKVDLSARDVEVRLLTGVSEDEKFETYITSSITLFPSKFEGFGYPPVESIASGTPVIAYDLPVFRETLGSLFTSVKLQNSDGFSLAVASALEEGVERIGPEDSARVAQKYSLKKVASQLSAEFQSIQFRRTSLLKARISLTLMKLLYRFRKSLRRVLK